MNEELKTFLRLVMEHQMPNKEKTIFSLGGRGYYENAASDMLGFFLQPDNEHGFGTLFLSALFDCMGVSSDGIPQLTGVTVEREIKTKHGKFIDLQILGDNWCLIVENKIWHLQNNPFKDYENHAKSLGKDKNFFTILSPHGEGRQPGWSRISYKAFCANLRERLGQAAFKSPHSKWHLFAREFVLHIENELYNPMMPPELANFVEQHEQQIVAVKKLDAEYRQFLQSLLKQTLEEIVSGHVFSTKVVERWHDEQFAVRCYSNKWGQANLVFWKDKSKFKLSVYLVNLAEKQLEKAQKEFIGLHFEPEGTSWVYWVTQRGFDTRGEAIKELTRLAAIVGDVLQAPSEPVGSPANSAQPSTQ